MCLFLAKKIYPEEDIKCYKILYRNKENGRLNSPYFDHYWTIGATDSIDAEKADLIYNSPLNCDCVYGFCFHTFKRVEEAMLYAEELEHIQGPWKMVIVECTIPKESAYVYIGVVPFDGKFADGFASQQLRIDKILEEEL